MERFVVGTAIVIAGFLAILFREKLFRENIEFESKTFGTRFSDKELRFRRWFVPICGITVIAIGIAVLLGLIGMDP